MRSRLVVAAHTPVWARSGYGERQREALGEGGAGGAGLLGLGGGPLPGARVVRSSDVLDGEQPGLARRARGWSETGNGAEHEEPDRKEQAIRDVVHRWDGAGQVWSSPRRRLAWASEANRPRGRVPAGRSRRTGPGPGPGRRRLGSAAPHDLRLIMGSCTQRPPRSRRFVGRTVEPWWTAPEQRIGTHRTGDAATFV